MNRKLIKVSYIDNIQRVKIFDLEEGVTVNNVRVNRVNSEQMHSRAWLLQNHKYLTFGDPEGSRSLRKFYEVE